MRYCFICKQKNIPGSVKFFSVPKDENKRQEWMRICQRDIKVNSHVCIEHFKRSDIIAVGRRFRLMPNALPIVQQQQESTVPVGVLQQYSCPMEYEVKHEIDPQETTLQGLRYFTLEQITSTAASKTSEPILKECQTERNNPAVGRGLNPNVYNNVSNNSSFSDENKDSIEIRNEFLDNRNRELNKIVMPPQLEEPIMKIPTTRIKSVSCSKGTQTNIRICGLVEASDFADEFRFNCFYCSQVFPLEQWTEFVNHLNETHSQLEEAFKTSKYLSKEHDYTPISLPPPTPAKTALEVAVYNVEPDLPPLVDPLETTNSPIDTLIFNSNFHGTPYSNNTRNKLYNSKKKRSFLTQFLQRKSKFKIHMNKKNYKRKLVSSRRSVLRGSTQQTSKRSALSRCLKRTNDEHVEPKDVEELEELQDYSNYGTDPIAIVQQNPTEIAFQYTPRPIVDLLLDSMKRYPVLWQFDDEPFNEDFYEAVEDLCEVINAKWSINIDNLKMRRSINRILRFYCYLFPNENLDQFTNYYDKCTNFLPSVDEIAYARCSHCYVCFKHDFDLQLHLSEEQKYLEWPYKCPKCKESFRLWDEYVFHKHLPHYDEIFRCQPCNKSFFRRLLYKKHMVEEHQKDNDPARYKCDICDKAVESLNGLKLHKQTHGERKYKCHLCPKSYFEKSKLALHLKIHRREADFICEVCGKEFFTQNALKIHMTKHTGEKVTCNICNLRLRKSSLSRHMRIVHVVNIDVEGLGEKISRGKPIYYRRLIKSKRPIERKKGDERKYKCKICKVSFDSYKLVVNHNKELHSDMPRWPCKICTGEFRQKVNLKSHYRTKHDLHVLQVYRLVEVNDDLNEVLDMKMEDIENMLETLKKSNPENTTKSNFRSEMKADLLPDEIYFSEEKIHSSTIQDEIMKAVDDIETEDIKIDYMDDMLTDFLN